MTSGSQPKGRANHGVPRWPALIAILVIGLIYVLIPARYALGPPWLILALAIAALILILLSRRLNRPMLTRILGRLVTMVLTLAIAASAILLLVRVGEGVSQALPLLRDAAMVWIANIIVFALWYWEIDGGGPAERHPGRHSSTDFAFPQQQQDDDYEIEGWSPGFLDYLFLAFNTSTAFSPTDTLVLSRRAKVLMMLQALISLLVVGVLAARAINTIGS